MAPADERPDASERRPSHSARATPAVLSLELVRLQAREKVHVSEALVDYVRRVDYTRAFGEFVAGLSQRAVCAVLLRSLGAR